MEARVVGAFLPIHISLEASKTAAKSMLNDFQIDRSELGQDFCSDYICLFVRCL